MPATTEAVKVQHTNVPFLTADNGARFGSNLATGVVSAAQVRGYKASIGSWLWQKNDGAAPALRERLVQAETDPGLAHWLGQRDEGGPAYAPTPLLALPPNVLDSLRFLDRIALDLKAAAGHTYRCTPATAETPKQLTRITAAEREDLEAVIGLFDESFADSHLAMTQTVAHLPPPKSTYRIDRENLSADPPRHWTYRLQKGGETNAGIQMEADVQFFLPDVRREFTRSLSSVPAKAQNQSALGQGYYVRLSAPDWFRAILAA